MSDQLKKVKVKIKGMHCANCEVLIERKFKEVAGVEKVRASRGGGQAVLYCSADPNPRELEQSIAEHGYHVTAVGDDRFGTEGPSAHGARHYAEIGGIALVVVAAYILLQRLNIIPTGWGVSDGTTYGVIFAVGLIASVSTCMAVTGGLLLAISARYGERHPELSQSQKLKPLLYFNAGRLIGYPLFGAAIGAVGSALTLSTTANGVITILASVAMIVLGMQLLHLFPSLQRMSLVPKALSHKIHDLTGSDSRFAPFTLGGLTFFLPCGFTQALQLYVLSRGSASAGALIMLFFALGTLPALLSVSIISTALRGSAQRYLLKFAGVIAVLFGILNVQNGLNLTGVTVQASTLFNQNQGSDVAATAAPIVDGVQVIKMVVTGIDYEPANFTVRAGIPVRWEIDASRAAGCMSAGIVASRLGIRSALSRSNITTVAFTPKTAGTYGFSCPMGMGTPGAAITVVDQPSS